MRFVEVFKSRGFVYISFPLFLQLIFYSLVLFFDFRLLNWYNDFYTSIQQKSIESFYSQILIFLFITFCQAFLLGTLSFNSDVYEARLKRYFAEKWARLRINDAFVPYEKSKLDQRIIDDSNLAAEKIAIIVPTMIFNAAKALTFLFLLSLYPSKVSDFFFGFTCPFLDQYALCIFGASYLVLQLFITQRVNGWIFKSERIKRSIESKARYKMLTRGMNMYSLQFIVFSYVRAVVKIRFTVGKAHGLNIFFINLISSFSIAVPFLIIFHSYVVDAISFGELMKISATYAGFQSASLYVFNFYKELFRGFAAISRLSERVV